MDEPLDQIRRSVANAQPASNVVRMPERGEPPDDGDRGGGDDGGDEDGLRDDGLPADCPVVPLGKKGRTFYYLNPKREIIQLSAKDHSRNELAGLFSPFTHLLEEYWPRRKLVEIETKDGEKTKQWMTTGFKVEDCANQLMDACSRLDIWKDHHRVRGAGGWADDDGSLVYHVGNALWMLDERGNAATRDCGRHDGYVYVTDAPIMRPYDEPIGEDDPDIVALYDLIKTWNWQRPMLDPLFAMGLIAAGMVGGALDWRPMGFLTGDMSTGKSTFQQLIGYLHGTGGMVQTADTSAAGLYQEVGHSSLPIGIDELENEAQPDKVQAVIKLARLSSSGSVMLRGGADHKGVSFTARSVFLFSAIIMPPLSPQDRRRMVLLRLNPLPRDAKQLSIEREICHAMGRKMRRRLADQWPQFRKTLSCYRTMLAKAGHTSGGCDQFGTLLALYHMLFNNAAPAADHLAHIAQHMDAAKFRETADMRSDAENCVDWLAQSQPDVYKGGIKKSIAQLVCDLHDPTITEERPIRDMLSATGLAHVRSKDGLPYLAVPYNHRMVSQIFQGSNWSGKPGVSGGWVEALSRLPGVVINKTARIGGQAQKCLMLPVELIAAIEKRVLDDPAGAEERI